MQLEGQSATSAIFAIAKVALRFNLLFLNIAEVALWTKVFKICCTIVALRFQFFFFRLAAQFYTLNLIFFHFDRNIDKCRPSSANYLLFFCLKSKNCGICIALRNFNRGSYVEL